MPPERSTTPVLLGCCLILSLGTLLTFQHVISNGFINFDDPTYVQGNPLLHRGLTADNVGLAFTSFHGGYWIPLTWISYQIDYSLYGLDPGGYHRTNLVLHATTAVLLFLLLCRPLTLPSPPAAGGEGRVRGRPAPRIGRCLLAASLFAIHPVQVESVAWVTERKDVLSTLFHVLTVWSYVRYVERPGWQRDAPVALCLMLGLMAKPMLVTLPCLLLLLDWWPLCRSGWRWLVVEKLPLFALAFAGGILCIIAQETDTAVRTLDEFPIDMRIGNAIVSYVDYLGMLLWPSDLAVFYPHPGASLSVVRIALSAVLVCGLTAGAFLMRRRAPYLLAGWLWYLGTLAPVSGLLQAGWQGKADRFLYVPAIGLFIAVSWAVAELTGSVRWRRVVLVGVSAVALLTCTIYTQAQVLLWKDSRTLWEHTVSVTPENFVAENSLGAALLDAHRPDEALARLLRARELKPDHELAHFLLGVAYRNLERVPESEECLRDALAISPRYVEAHAALAVLLTEQERLDEAGGHAERAVSIDPRSATAQHSLGVVHARLGEAEAALAAFREAVRLDPHAISLRMALARELRRHGLEGDAAAEIATVRRLYPGWQGER